MNKTGNESRNTFASVLNFAEKEQDKVKGHREKVSQALLELATGLQDSDQFLEGCIAAEKQRRLNIKRMAKEKSYSKAETKEMLKLPRLWTQAKSDIKAAWEFGMSPKDFGSFAELAKKLNDRRVEIRGSRKKADGNGAEVAVDATSNTVTSVLFGEVMERISKLDSITQELICEELTKIVDEYVKDAPVVDLTDEESGDDMEALEEAQVAVATA